MHGPSLPARSTNGLLEVRNLRISVSGRSGAIVDGLSFSIAPGEVLGIVGESGCGKTITARSIIGLTRFDRRFRVDGEILYKGVDLLGLDEPGMRAVRGKEIAMIFQDPMSSLNPLQRVGSQIAEMVRAHESLSARAARDRTVDLMRQVGISHAEQRVHDYPHQYSGGMRQRIMIALALACRPSLLLADEPTTALDVTTQMQILDLLAGLQSRLGMAVILITHDLGIVAESVDRLLVMYAGQCVESGTAQDVFGHPQHPYTRGLLDAVPSAHRQRVARLSAIKGSPPSLDAARPPGCSFRPRCGYAFEQCLQEPMLDARTGDADHLDRCWLVPAAKRAAFASAAERQRT